VWGIDERSILRERIAVLGLAVFGAIFTVASLASGAVSTIGGTGTYPYYAGSSTCQKQPVNGFALQGDAADDTIPGSGQRDLLRGAAGDDKEFGKASDDCVRGQEGDDKVNGGSGNDSVSGSTGDDKARGGSGNDKLTGGQGNDKLRGGSGDDELFGGDDTDKLFAGSGKNILNCGQGPDVAVAKPNDDVNANCETVRIRGD
jgi:Ca2+-binding RTX toxin-like protein